MTNVMVLGGSGFVGAHLCEKLVRQGVNVTVPTRRRNNARNVMHLPGVTVLELDVHDGAALTRALAGHDAVVNLVAILHGNPAAFERVHVELVHTMARACVAAGVRRVVQVSALGAHDVQPDAAPSNYLRSKGRGEAVLLHPAAGAPALDVTVLRPSVVFGAQDQFLNLFARLQAVFPFMPLACADAKFQPVWVEDLAQALVNCLVRAPQTHRVKELPRILQVCGPHVFTLRELVQLSARLADINEGRGRPVLALPAWAGRLQAALMELAPGAPLMSRDNLDSMQIDNVAQAGVPGLEALGITPASLAPVAAQYLARDGAESGLIGIRKRAR